MIATSLPVAGAASTVPATPTRTKGQSVYVDTTRVYPTGYNINDNNYFKLRDIGQLVGFGWIGTKRRVRLSSPPIALPCTHWFARHGTDRFDRKAVSAANHWTARYRLLLISSRQQLHQAPRHRKKRNPLRRRVRHGNKKLPLTRMAYTSMMRISRLPR